MTIRDSFNSMFKMVDPNGKYKPAKVAAFYYVLGGCLVYHPIKDSIIGDIDMRFSHGICITSGRGKDAIKNTAFETAEDLKLKYEEFTSLHEEQLIGKKWYDKELKEDREIKGYFGDDFIEKDDGLVFLNSDKYELARNYMLRCLNPYGKNLISKRLTAEQEGLKYFGTASFRHFIQPSEKIKENNLTSGLFRRCPILRIDLTREEEREIKNKRLRASFNPNTKEFLDFVKILRNIRNIRYIKINEKIIDIINEEVDNYESDNKLLSSLYLESQNTIVKWSYVNTLLRLYSLKRLKSLEEVDLEISEEDVRWAIEDYRIVYSAIKDFVFGNIIKNDIEKAIVSYVKSNRGKSSPQIISEVTKNLSKPEATVKWHFYSLKAKGIINTKQITKRVQKPSGKLVNVTTSEVWI